MDANIQEGIILIPDFNGFTEFVFNTKLYTGEYIVRQLLSILIDVNNQYFEISEIEGDAILFFRYDRNPSFKKVSKILRNMQNAFMMKVRELNEALSINIDLSLKFIVHYGAFSQYKIGSFRKLYGKPVVEAHQLLKNDFAKQPSYALFSSSFLENTEVDKDFYTDEKQDLPEVGEIHYFEKIEQHI